MYWLPALMLAVVPSHVAASLHETIARFIVRAEVTVEAGPSHGSQDLLDLPDHAMIVAGSVRVFGHTEQLELARTASVEATFEHLFIAPAGHGRAWAVRLDRTDTTATFEVDAPRAATLTFELTMDAPTCFFGDRRYVHVADGWSDQLPGLHPSATRDDIEAACGSDEGGSWISFPTSEVSAQPSGAQRVGVLASQLPLADRRIARIEVALASELLSVPDDLHTAILVDHSGSVTGDERDNEQAIIAAYLAAVPKTHVQVFAFSRTTQPLLGGWTVAERASGQIARALANLPPRNGSDVDAALSAASPWLDHARGTRRVLVLTDERLADRISGHADALAKLVPAGTLVHVVVVTGTSGSVERDDTAVLAPLAKATGGIAAEAGLGEHATVDVRGLVRPLTVDHMSISGPGWAASLPDQNACTVDDGTLDAGKSCVWWAESTRGDAPLTLTGELWGQTIKRTFTPDGRQALAVARILSALDSLPPELREQVNLAAHAVDSVWTLFATWGGRGGYGETSETGDIAGDMTIGGIGGSAIDTITDTIGVAPSVRPELVRQLQGAVAGCKPPGNVTVRVETTFDEIVDVEVMTPDLGTAEPCVREAIWDATLSLSRPVGHTNLPLVFQRS